MRKQRETDWPVLLSELVDQGYAETAGQLLDRLYAEGSQVGMNSQGLAVRLETADRLRAEREETERIAREEAEKAETERLARLAELEKRREAEQEAAARDAAFRERVARLERAMGGSMIELEREVRRSRTHAPDTGLSYDQRMIEENRVITIDEVEQYIRAKYGDDILDREEAK